MTFRISSGSSAYTFPIDPQSWEYTPEPRINVQKTLGGQVVQLLGYSVRGSFGGFLHGRSVSRQDAWNDMSLLKSFMSTVIINQKNGISSHLSWSDQGFDFDCALGDLSISESLEQTGFTYSISYAVVNQSPLRDGNSFSSVFGTIMASIGYKVSGTPGAYHGGNGNVDVSKVRITGMSGSGPAVSGDSSDSGSSDGGAQLSSNPSIAEIQKYAHDQVINKYHWSEADFQALVNMWNKESGWNYKAENPSSKAYGIPQANPSGGNLIALDPKYRNDPKFQVDWGLDYIAGRYGTPSAAWARWQSMGWY